MSTLKTHLENGTYTLIILASDELMIAAGGLGLIDVLPGYYTYTGSALGNGSSSLQLRLARHLRISKKKRWHIDFLLADKNVNVEAIATVLSKQPLECQINQLINRQMKARILIPKFGASDCQNGCGSHLLYFGKREIKHKIHALFKREFGTKSAFHDLARTSPFRTLEPHKKQP
jgi:Uri superfamily endonuclease